MMETYHSRPLESEDDLACMTALAQQFPHEHLHSTDLPYRFSSWALDWPENARLWFDARGAPAAWCAVQSPFWTLDFAFHPAHECALTAEVLAWGEDRARALAGGEQARPCWFAVAFARQRARIAALEAAGFADQGDVGEDSWSKVWLRRDGQAPVAGHLPPAGFRARALAGPEEVDAAVALHQEVFESKNMTAAWRARALRQPLYRPELDVVIESPDGRLAAYCTGWLSADGRRGQVEPLGCRAEFRRYALGRVALCEVLRRLQGLGAQEVFVETDNYRNTAYGLYQNVGFALHEDVRVFRKDLEEEAE